jgi:hypothetical protein
VRQPTLGVFLALMSDCTDDLSNSVARTINALLPADCTALGSALVDHSCKHATAGPFMMVAGALDSAAQAPAVNAVHTHYTITLPDGQNGADSGTVRYRPQRSGEWVIFTASEVPLKVSDAADMDRPSIYAEDQTSCPELPFANSYELVSGVTYELRLGPSATPEVAIVIEKVDDFIQTYFADADGDGEGNPESTLVTACVPPQGVVDNDTDCDDNQSAVNTDAAERCDGLDNDCDTRIDEQLSCDEPKPATDAGAAPPRAGEPAAEGGRSARDAGRTEADAGSTHSDAGTSSAAPDSGSEAARDVDAGSPADGSIEDIMAEAVHNSSQMSATSDGCHVATVGGANARATWVWLIMLGFPLLRRWRLSRARHIIAIELH